MESPLTLPALTNDLLEEIFLRVASPADLARASTACVSFRCLITNPAFLRRYRSIHPPLFLGFLSSAGFQPAQAPQPNAAIAAAVARAADFSFDYLPPATEGERYRWLRHVLGGRVLFECAGMRDNAHFVELLVCDPLFRRYLLLPSITDDLLASADIRNMDLFDSRASLIPCAGMEEDETSFSVICWMTSITRLAVFFFSSVSGRWSVVTSIQWADLGLYGEEVNLLGSCRCIYGCFYWKIYCISKLLKLDMNTMVISTYNLPPDHDKRNIIIVELGEGKIAMVSQPDEGTSVDCYTFLQNDSEMSHEWHLMNTIPLPADYTIRHYIDGASEGCIFLVGTKEQDETDLAIFSIEIKSRRIERVCTTSSAFQFAHPYFGFPPSMSPRRIQEY